MGALKFNSDYDVFKKFRSFQLRVEDISNFNIFDK
jgi:hypothetical protein